MVNIEGLNTKVFAKGSSFPKYDGQKIRLYSMRYCPFAHRALLTMAAKNIPFEIVNVNLSEKPEWFVADINPLGKVPAIQVKDKVVYESMVVAEFADEEFKGSRNIVPKDNYERAKQKMTVERLSKLIMAIYPLYKNPTDETCVKNVLDAIQLHEDLLENNYFAGNECGFVDYMVWPFLERLGAVALLTQGKITVGKENYPKLAAYIERMKARPEVKVVSHTPEDHLAFIKSHDPDLGL